MDPILKFTVNNQRIYRDDNFHVVSGSKNYLTASFLFLTPEWEGKTKTAIFHADKPYSVILVNDTCEVPWEFTAEPGSKYVSVFAGDLITANKAMVEVWESGYIEGETPEPPTPSAYEQFVSLVEEIGDKASTSARQAVAAAEAAAQSQEHANTSASNAAISETNAKKSENATEIAASEIVADREQIKTNKSDINELKSDISQLSEEIDDLKSSGTGASDTVMSFILALFRKTKFYEDASTEYSQLEAIVKSDTVVYTITSNLTNVSSNNSATSGEKNSSYICTLAADEGYSIDSVTVVMGGSDITSTAYNNETGEIAISKLTGNIVITASAVSASRVYIYNNGDQCTDITGGWYADGSSSSVDKTIDGLPGYTFICTHYGYDKNSRAMMVNSIDLSNYKKLGFKLYSTLETLSDTVIARLSYLDNSSGSWVRSNNVGVTLNSLGDGWYEGEADLSYSVETLVNNAHTGVSTTNGNINQIWLE